jgi:PRD1 phage membrane DNA delivery
MGDRVITDLFAVATAIVSLAVIAVLVSKSANTGTVVTSIGTAFASDLKAATSPLGGGVGVVS